MYMNMPCVVRQVTDCFKITSELIAVSHVLTERSEILLVHISGWFWVMIEVHHITFLGSLWPGNAVESTAREMVHLWNAVLETVFESRIASGGLCPHTAKVAKVVQLS